MSYAPYNPSFPIRIPNTPPTVCLLRFAFSTHHAVFLVCEYRSAAVRAVVSVAFTSSCLDRRMTGYGVRRRVRLRQRIKQEFKKLLSQIRGAFRKRVIFVIYAATYWLGISLLPKNSTHKCMHACHKHHHPRPFSML